MTNLPATPFLRTVLLADAGSSAAAGLLLVGGSRFLAGWLGLPADLLFWAGFSFLPFAALVAWTALRPTMPRALVYAIIAFNALFALDCVIALLTGALSPTALGTAFVFVQALIIAAFAELEYVGVRRTAAVA
jgi:hypothetical protein